MTRRPALMIAIVLGVSVLTAAVVHAQTSVTVGGQEIQVQGFISQGFAATSDNNYLRMDTSRGSFFTEAGLNVSATLSRKLRVGIQLYDRYIGELGKGRVYLDWAMADYRFKDYLGVRGGKIKTTLGLYTDTQDQSFLHTWALLPQGVYPADLRSVSVAHVGGDVYGHINTHHGGSLSYTAFAGSVPDDSHGGFVYGIEAAGGTLTSGISGRTAGLDVRWTSPIPGLMVGATLVRSHGSFNANFGPAAVPFSYSTTRERATAIFAEYARGNLIANAEYRGQSRRAELLIQLPGPQMAQPLGSDQPAWFVTGAYRLSPKVEVGGYFSHYRVTAFGATTPGGIPGGDHIFDRVITTRFDLTRFWSLKIEGHFMDGVGSPGDTHGFYPQDNPRGLDPITHMLVLRTSLYF